MTNRFPLQWLPRRGALLAVCLAAWTAGLAPAARAVDLNGLYQAEVPVAGQDSASRDRAAAAALAEVVVKVSGDRRAPEQPVVAEAVAQAARWVQQYRYREGEAVVGQQGADGKPAEAERFLWVSFDPAAVNRLLERAQLPVWGRTRPLTLVWLAVEDGRERYLFDPDLHSDLKSMLMKRAGQRGMPLIFPLMDLEDQRHVSVSDVWGNFGEAIWSASQRYGAEAVLVGRIFRGAEGEWQGRWSLYQGGEPETWSEGAASMEQALAGGVQGAADTLAQRFAHVLSGMPTDAVDVDVYGVSQLGDYARAKSYLASLGPVAEVDVLQVAHTQVTFRLALRGSRDGLIQTIGLGDVLETYTATAPVAGAGVQAAQPALGRLSYRLAP